MSLVSYSVRRPVATVAATLATAPLLAFHFERLSIVSLAANLLARFWNDAARR